MDTVEIKLNMLIDGMQKKELALTEIVSITENQGTVLQSGISEEEVRMFIVEMNREKQAHIKTVQECDGMFERVLKEIGAHLDAHPELYNKEIADLQARIRRVVDLDVKIRVCEDQNNRLMIRLGPRKTPLSKPVPIIHDSNRVIEAYKNNAK